MQKYINIFKARPLLSSLSLTLRNIRIIENNNNSKKISLKNIFLLDKFQEGYCNKAKIDTKIKIIPKNSIIVILSL